MFAQPDLEELLARRAAELGSIEIRRAVEVTACTQDDERVVVTDTAGRAWYAVGCDGSNSTMRDLCGLVPHDLGAMPCSTPTPANACPAPARPRTAAPRRDLRHKPRGQLWDGNAVAEMRH